MPELKANSLVLLGVCSDENSSFMQGPAQAPGQIRTALHNGSANLSSELGVNLSGHDRFYDAGDFTPEPGVEGFMSIEQQITQLLANGAYPLTLGGDHAITYPIMRAIANHHGPVTILHFDAHPDLYDELDGNKLSHACPFARIMEQGLAKRLIQIGIRTLNQHQSEQARRFNVEVHPMNRLNLNQFRLSLDGPVYLSFDMDALDPAFAPGVSHFEPGGLSVRDVLKIIQQIEAPIIGADIVEYNPLQDINHMTAMVAAKLIKEIGGKILQTTEH